MDNPSALPEPIVTVDSSPVPLPTTTDATTYLADVWGHWPMVTSIPTWIPKTFRDSVALDSGTGRIWAYDFTNNKWRPNGNSVITTYTPSIGGTATIDLSLGNVFHITMPAGNATIALSNGSPGQCFIIRILQDGTGSRTVTWFTTIRWAGGSAPSLTTTASKADSFGFEITGTNTYDGFIVGQSI